MKGDRLCMENLLMLCKIHSDLCTFLCFIKDIQISRLLLKFISVAGRFSSFPVVRFSTDLIVLPHHGLNHRSGILQLCDMILQCESVYHTL